MTTLYKPVLIETAEQADQLPEGAFIIDALDLVARLEKTGRYAGRWLTEEDGCLNDPVMPAQAFVPIEAEEEYGAEMKWDARTPHDTHVSLGLGLDNAHWQAKHNPDYATGRIMRRYVTRWEHTS